MFDDTADSGFSVAGIGSAAVLGGIVRCTGLKLLSGAILFSHVATVVGLSTFVARTDSVRFVDLRRSIDGLTEEALDDGEAALKRGFYLPTRCVNGFVGPTQERRDLGDTEYSIGVEREREKHLAWVRCSSWNGVP
jgi:hypothetical protein